MARGTLPRQLVERPEEILGSPPRTQCSRVSLVEALESCLSNPPSMLAVGEFRYVSYRVGLGVDLGLVSPE